MNGFRFYILCNLFFFLIITPSLAQDKEYDPYTLPGFEKYKNGKLGSRQQSKVDTSQKKYQDGYAIPGEYSYKKGSLKDWQKKFYPQLVQLMGLNAKAIKSTKGYDGDAK